MRVYKSADGKADLRRKELKSLILMLVSTAALGVLVWLTVQRYGVRFEYVAIYVLWFAASVVASKVYLFFTPRCRYGTVTAIKDFKPTFIRSSGGASGAGATYSGMDVVECTVTVDFDKGKARDYVFIHRGDLKILKVGDRIGIFRFLKMPVWETDPEQKYAS